MWVEGNNIKSKLGITLSIVPHCFTIVPNRKLWYKTCLSLLFETFYLYLDIHKVFLLHANVPYIFSCPQNGRELNPYNYSLSTAENLSFSDTFRWYRKRPVVWNELTLEKGLLKTVKDSSRSSKYFWCSAEWLGETVEPRFYPLN